MKGFQQFLPDTYTRRARVYPFFLAALPIALSFLAWYPDGTAGWGALWGVLVWGGGTALVAQLGRDSGRGKQDWLFGLWGGSPTTRRLRHRDTANRIILSRRHERLRMLLSDVNLPTAQQEESDARGADEVYEACVDLLKARSRSRDAFPLVFEENCNYGFRRNVWGMKPLGVTLAMLGVLATSVFLILKYTAGSPVSPVELMCGAVNIALLGTWIFVITPDWVRVPAEAYADQLLAACDVLDP